MKNIYLFILLLLPLRETLAQNYAIGQTTITFNDPTRSGGFGSGGGPGRQIQTEIYYPADVAGVDVNVSNGEFPVLVFGHGFAMAWDAYENIWEDLVSKGYIMAFPRTEGSLLPPPSHNNFGLDLALVEVKMQAFNTNPGSLFFQKIADKSALMGHSMGGGAAFIGAANNTSPTLKAIVGLAPAETNPSAISAASNVTVNGIIFSGSSDGVTPPSSNHQPIYNNLASTCKTFISINNGSHCYFANSNFNCDFGELTTGTGSLPRSQQHEITSDYLTLWLDFELKSSCTSWDAFLDSLAVSTKVVEQQSCNYGYLQPDVSISGINQICSGDSITLQATINPSYTNYNWYLNGVAIGANQNSLEVFQTGNYVVSASNVFTCIDSSNSFGFTVNPSYTIFDTAFACIGSTFTFPDGSFTTIDTTHISQFLSQSNCDSSISTTVFFGTSVVGNQSISLCAEDTFFFNSTSYTSDTQFSDTIIAGSQFGCDSITIFDVSFLVSDSVFVSEAICQGENYLLPSGLFTNIADTYYFDYQNSIGCDSVYAIDLVLGTPIPIIDLHFFNFAGNTIGDTVGVYLANNLAFDSLIWRNDTNSIFLYQVNDTAYFEWGEEVVSYEIEVTLWENGCSRIGGTTLSIVRIKDLYTSSSLKLYPNPVRNVLHIEAEEKIGFVEIYDVLGRLRFELMVNGKVVFLDLNELENGLYYFKSNAGIRSFVKD